MRILRLTANRVVTYTLDITKSHATDPRGSNFNTKGKQNRGPQFESTFRSIAQGSEVSVENNAIERLRRSEKEVANRRQNVLGEPHKSRINTAQTQLWSRDAFGPGSFLFGDAPHDLLHVVFCFDTTDCSHNFSP
jgi:hypothetical protein